MSTRVRSVDTPDEVSIEGAEHVSSKPRRKMSPWDERRLKERRERKFKKWCAQHRREN